MPRALGRVSQFPDTTPGLFVVRDDEFVHARRDHIALTSDRTLNCPGHYSRFDCEAAAASFYGTWLVSEAEESPHLAQRAITALGALAQETRLDLFRLLVTRGPEGLPAGVIAERLGVLPSSLSFHLAQLVHAGLITQRRLSRQIIYSAEYDAMNELLTYLTENCCAQSTVCCGSNCEPAETAPDTNAA
jgi:DNA-binding transcriptional ArsR family regulator